MSYRLQFDETLSDAVPRIAREQVDRALAQLDDRDVDTGQAIHDVRKRCKKIRGLLRLVRGSISPSYGSENVRFRDLAKRLSGLRDAEAMLECFDRLRKGFEPELEAENFAPLRAALVARCREVQHNSDVAEKVDVTVEDLRAARQSVLGWRLDEDGFDALAAGFKRTYKRARKARHAAFRSPADAQFHQWRKRVVYHRHHLRLLRSVWPAPMKALSAEAKRLADLLGDDHDLAVLCVSRARETEWFDDSAQLDALAGLARRRQAQLRAQAWSLGWRLFGDKPSRKRQRMENYWQAAQREAAPPPV
jgi:CHAD domain-containing protein